MTTVVPGLRADHVVVRGVYAPQHDSHLLIDAWSGCVPLTERSVADVCTGSGVVGIAAARLGADRVSAWDISESAVQCARAADAAGVVVDVRRGSLDRALARGPYDIVVSNPRYVPAPEGPLGESIPDEAGPPWAYNAGEDGRMVLDPLCHAVPDLLTPAGTFLVVHSEFSGIGETLRALRMRGVTAQIAASQRIPFGPVLTARAQWLQDTGRMTLGQRRERLVVIRADR